MIDSVEKILLDAIQTVQDDNVRKKLEDSVEKIRQMRKAEELELSKERMDVDHTVLGNFL